MKRKILSALAIILTISSLSCEIFAMTPVPSKTTKAVTASSTKESTDKVDKLAKKIKKQFTGYDYYLICLNRNKLSKVGSRVDVKITEAEATKATCLTDCMTLGEGFYVKPSKNGYINASMDDAELYAHFFSESAVSDACSKLFGKKANINSLSSQFKVGLTGDVVKVTGSKRGAMVLYDVYEDENDCLCRKTNLKKQGSKYVLTKELYCGYWGAADNSPNNFKIVYTIAPNTNSKYGVAIESVSVYRIAE